MWRGGGVGGARGGPPRARGGRAGGGRGGGGGPWGGGRGAGGEVVAVEGAVDACACRENTSKTSRIPAASIAHCAARRAARRKASCGIGGSPPRETGPDTTAHL